MGEAAEQQEGTEGQEAGGGEGGDQGGQQGAGGLMATALAGQQGGKPQGQEGDQGGDGGDDNGVRSTIERPDWCPEQFWDAKEGRPNNEAMVKSWQDTRTRLKELESQSKYVAPESPADYAFEVEGLPDGYSLPDDDPVLQLFKECAHEAGVPQEVFSKMAPKLVQGIFSLAPDDYEPVDENAERAKLGENADHMINSVVAQAKQLQEQGLWTEDEFKEVVMMNSTANGIRAMNKLFRHVMGEAQIPRDAGGEAGLMSESELYAAFQSEKYRNDANYRNEVDAMAKRVFGTGPAGTSKQGLGVN